MKFSVYMVEIAYGEQLDFIAYAVSKYLNLGFTIHRFKDNADVSIETDSDFRNRILQIVRCLS